MVVSGHNIKKGMGVKKEQLVARFKDTKEWYFLIFFLTIMLKKITKICRDNVSHRSKHVVHFRSLMLESKVFLNIKKVNVMIKNAKERNRCVSNKNEERKTNGAGTH